MAILGAAKSASFAIPTIIDKVEASSETLGLREVCLGYAVIGPGEISEKASPLLIVMCSCVSISVVMPVYISGSGCSWLIV